VLPANTTLLFIVSVLFLPCVSHHIQFRLPGDGFAIISFVVGLQIQQQHKVAQEIVILVPYFRLH